MLDFCVRRGTKYSPVDIFVFSDLVLEVVDMSACLQVVFVIWYCFAVVEVVVVVVVKPPMF